MGGPRDPRALAVGLVLVGATPIRDNEALSAALLGLREPIAVDTEFHSEHRYRPKLMLVQICGAGGQPVLVDARSGLDLGRLGAALSGRRLLTHAPTRDLQLLAERAGLEPGVVLDTQTLAAFAGLGFPRSLDDLLRGVLDCEPKLGATLSDWSVRPLSDEQLRYAADDVRHLHPLTEALLARLDGPRRSWSSQACAELVEAALRPVDPGRAWQRISASRILDPEQLGVLQALAAWREQAAADQNQPRWHVASDAILVDLARRRPATVEALVANRKFPRRLARAHGPLLVELCGSSPPGRAQLRPSRRAALEAYLGALAHRLSLELGVAPDLLIPQSELSSWVDWFEAVIRGDDRPIPVSGWRKRALEGELSRFVTGEISLSFKDLTGRDRLR